MAFFLLLNIFGKPFMYHVLWRVENLSLACIGVSLNLSMLFEKRYKIEDGSALENIILLVITVLNLICVATYTYCILVAAKAQVLEHFSDPNDPDGSLSWEEIKVVARVKFYRVVAPKLRTMGIKLYDPEAELEKEILEMMEEDELERSQRSQSQSHASRPALMNQSTTSDTGAALFETGNWQDNYKTAPRPVAQQPLTPRGTRRRSTLGVSIAAEGNSRSVIAALGRADDDDDVFGAATFDTNIGGGDVGERRATRRRSSLANSMEFRRQSGVSRHSQLNKKSFTADMMPQVMVKELGYDIKYPKLFNSQGQRRSTVRKSLAQPQDTLESIMMQATKAHEQRTAKARNSEAE